MRPRIIILEDDSSTRNLLTLILKRRNFEVVSASEPIDCPLYADLDTPCTHEFPCGDFLLSDNRMPRMSGLEFIARQKERGCKGVIHNKAIISGTWEGDELIIAKQLGCKVFTKPYQLKDILAWLEQRKATLPPDRKLADLSESDHCK